MQPSIEQEIRQFVIDNFLFGQADTLNNDESFLESGIIDSTGVLELVGFLEQRFGLAIQDRELVPANLDSVSRVVQFVQRKQQAGEASLAG
jgi:acyl carrier protein